MEKIPANHSISFLKPADLRNEEGEVRRTAKRFDEDPDAFAGRFIHAFQNGVMIRLTPKLWEQLENTDSFEISRGDWGRVKYHAEAHDRDWANLREKIENNLPIEAPIVVKHKGVLHLVSGNTRLMVARALGKIPNVFFVSLGD